MKALTFRIILINGSLSSLSYGCNPILFARGSYILKKNIKNRRRFATIGFTRTIPPSLPSHKPVDIAMLAAMNFFGACDGLVTVLTPLVSAARKWTNKSIYFSVLLTIDIHCHRTPRYCGLCLLGCNRDKDRPWALQYNRMSHQLELSQSFKFLNPEVKLINNFLGKLCNNERSVTATGHFCEHYERVFVVLVLSGRHSGQKIGYRPSSIFVLVNVPRQTLQKACPQSSGPIFSEMS